MHLLVHPLNLRVFRFRVAAPWTCTFFLFCFSFWLHWSSLPCTGFLSPWSVGTTLRCGVQASHCGDFCRCRAQALGMQASGVLVHGGLVASWHVVSSQTRDWTHVPCIGRRLPVHCTTRSSTILNLAGGGICVISEAVCRVCRGFVSGFPNSASQLLMRMRPPGSLVRM